MKNITIDQAVLRRFADRLLEDEKSHRYFVTVGLLHLVLPEDSVLWELEQRGCLPMPDDTP